MASAAPVSGGVDGIAVVTGASSGIGRVMAQKLAGLGYSLALIARREDALNETKASCLEINGDIRVEAFPCDLTDAAAINQLQEQIGQMGRVTVLINNAGYLSLFPVWDTSSKMDDVVRTMDVNITSVIQLTGLFVPQMKEAAAEGLNVQLIFVSSVLGKKAIPNASVYCAAKFAVRGFAAGCWEDLRDSGVKVTCLMPGYINTPMLEGLPTKKEELIQPEDMGILVESLLKMSKTFCPQEILSQEFPSNPFMG